MKLTNIYLAEDMGERLAPDREITSPEQFQAAIDEMTTRYTAAVRALGLVNKLSDGPTKKRHLSRVVSQMNTFRHYLNTLMSQLESMSQ